jgi:drug/metabolite transporter (DMT)-like permease
MGLLNNVIPFCLIAWSQGYIASSLAAILMGTLLLGEHLELRQVAGFALISVGLVVIDGRILSRFYRRARRHAPSE